MPFAIFTGFATTLFVFATFTDYILCTVVARASAAGVDFPTGLIALHVAWMCFQFLLLVDLVYVYYRYLKPRPVDEERPKIDGSEVRLPKAWLSCLSCRLDMRPASYLLMLSLLLPQNALFFYSDIGVPVYEANRLGGYDPTRLLLPGVWPSDGNVIVDRETWEVRSVRYGPLDPPLLLSAQRCYRPGSQENLIRGRLQGWEPCEKCLERYPKQAYCDSLLGVMMAESFGKDVSARDKTWKQEEDAWEEAFEFSLRLFSALAGLVADQSEGQNSMISMQGLSFLKDMTDVFDMYMMTFADVDQLQRGRPVLNDSFGARGYEAEYHYLVLISLWSGVVVVLLRAMAILGFQPFVHLIRRLGCNFATDDLRKPIDAFFSLWFIEVPYLFLRSLAWWYYGVPVSVMAVKNVLGIYEDLFYLGVVSGFGVGGKRRGIQLCLYGAPKDVEGAEPGEAAQSA